MRIQKLAPFMTNLWASNCPDGKFGDGLPDLFAPSLSEQGQRAAEMIFSYRRSGYLQDQPMSLQYCLPQGPLDYSLMVGPRNPSCSDVWSFSVGVGVHFLRDQEISLPAGVQEASSAQVDLDSSSECWARALWYMQQSICRD